MSDQDVLLGLIGDKATADAVLEWIHQRDREVIEHLDLHGDWLVEYVAQCTCGGGSLFPHEPHCGIEPIEDWGSKLSEVRGDAMESLATLFDERKPNGQAYNGYQVAREIRERAEIERKKNNRKKR